MARKGRVHALAERTGEGGAALVERTADAGGALIERAGEAGLAAAGSGLALADAAAGEIAEFAGDLFGAAGSAGRRLPWRMVLAIGLGMAAVAAIVVLLTRRRRSGGSAGNADDARRDAGLDGTLEDTFPSSDAPATSMSPGI